MGSGSAAALLGGVLLSPRSPKLTETRLWSLSDLEVVCCWSSSWSGLFVLWLPLWLTTYDRLLLICRTILGISTFYWLSFSPNSVLKFMLSDFMLDRDWDFLFVACLFKDAYLLILFMAYLSSNWSFISFSRKMSFASLYIFSRHFLTFCLKSYSSAKMT